MGQIIDQEKIEAIAAKIVDMELAYARAEAAAKKVRASHRVQRPERPVTACHGLR